MNHRVHLATRFKPGPPVSGQEILHLDPLREELLVYVGCRVDQVVEVDKASPGIQLNFVKKPIRSPVKVMILGGVNLELREHVDSLQTRRRGHHLGFSHFQSQIRTVHLNTLLNHHKEISEHVQNLIFNNQCDESSLLPHFSRCCICQLEAFGSWS
jgi:hypothetical protein